MSTLLFNSSISPGSRSFESSTVKMTPEKLRLRTCEFGREM